MSVDPLEAYMDSIASEIVPQASDVPAPSSTSPTSISSLTPSSTLKMIAHKVSSSPFCDLDVVGKGGAGAKFGRRRHRPGSSLAVPAAADSGGRASEAVEELLLSNPAAFLTRFGHILSPDDLESLLPAQDPAVALHVQRLRTLMRSEERRRHQEDDIDMPSAVPTPTASTARGDAGLASGSVDSVGEAASDAAGTRVRNRRYRRLQQLAEEGTWFSDEAMKERDPWLWFEYVGKRAGEEKPAPKKPVEEVPGSTSLGIFLQESLGFLSQPPPSGGWPSAVPAAARGSGSSLGMAFLSGVCVGAGTRDMGAGATVDLSDVPGLPSTGITSAGDPGTSSDMPAGQERIRADEIDTGTAAVTKAVRAISIGDEDADEEDVDGNTEATGSGEYTRRVRFVDERGVELGGDEGRGRDDDNVDHNPDFMQEEEEEDEEEEGEEDEEEEEEEGEGGRGWGTTGREEVARILSERFLAGSERGVDYKSVDEDERLDDLEQLSRDEQERWFRAEEDS